jgi:hypothetical protein
MLGGFKKEKMHACLIGEWNTNEHLLVSFVAWNIDVFQGKFIK